MKLGVFACFLFSLGPLVRSLDPKTSTELKPKGVVCREELSFSYRYLRFHPVSDIANLTNDGFRLDFKVRSKSNAHILFSENPFPQRDDTYEIVIGANQNKNSDIRRGKGTNSKQRMSTPDVLSPREPRGFWIYIHKDGRILVGKENDSMPILMWHDPTPLKIRFISFATWRDVYGNWFYNCKNYKEEEEEEKEEVITSDRPQSWTEKLRTDIFLNEHVYSEPRPSDSSESKRTVVHTHLACRHVELDEKRSVINVHGTLSMSWTDERLKWSPADYGNITSSVAQSWEVWIPELTLYNAADPQTDFLYNFGEFAMIVSHEGTVFWAPQVHLVAFCENIDLRTWPKDTQTCELRLGFLSQQHFLQLKLWENTTYLDENRVETEWKVTDVSAETVWIRTPWATAAVELGMDIPLLEDGTDLVDPVATDDSGELEIVVHTSMALRLTLERQNTSYNTLLLIPLAMILIFTLLSFWALPLGIAKLGLQCLSLVAVTLFLLVSARLLPAHSDHVPSIVSAYQTVMIMTCTSIVVTVIIICFTRYPPMRNLPSLVTLVLTSEWTTFLFFLPSDGEQVNVQYNSLKETHQLDDEQRKNDEADLQWSWIQLSTLIDRTMFFIYIILFVYIFSAFC